MIFLDSTFLIGFFVANDAWHEKATILYNEITNEKFLITDYIISKTVTMIGYKIGSIAANEVYNFLINNCEIYPMSRSLYDDCMEIHLTFNGSLSFVDALSVTIMKKERIYQIASFDSDFDKIIGIFRMY